MKTTRPVHQHRENAFDDALSRMLGMKQTNSKPVTVRQEHYDNYARTSNISTGRSKQQTKQRSRETADTSNKTMRSLWGPEAKVNKHLYITVLILFVQCPSLLTWVIGSW